MCDDVKSVVARLAKHGIETDGPIGDRGWGLLTTVSSARRRARSACTNRATLLAKRAKAGMT